MRPFLPAFYTPRSAGSSGGPQDSKYLYGAARYNAPGIWRYSFEAGEWTQLSTVAGRPNGIDVAGGYIFRVGQFDSYRYNLDGSGETRLPFGREVLGDCASVGARLYIMSGTNSSDLFGINHDLTGYNASHSTGHIRDYAICAGPDGTLLAMSNRTIRQYDVADFSIISETVVTGAPTGDANRGLAITPEGDVFATFYDGGTYNTLLFRGRLGEAFQLIVNDDNDFPGNGLAVHAVQKKVYYTGGQTLRRCNYDGSGLETIPCPSGTFKGIALG